MPFKGTEGKRITLRKAQTMIGGATKSRSSAPRAKAARIRGGFYGKKILLKILNQPNCIGIRYYHALNAKKQQTIVLVGEAKGGKLLTRMMVNEGPLCPPDCTKSAALGL